MFSRTTRCATTMFNFLKSFIMKKIFFAAIFVISATLVSFSSAALKGNTNCKFIKLDVNQTLKTTDTIGGQAGTVPPPPPPPVNP